MEKDNVGSLANAGLPQPHAFGTSASVVGSFNVKNALLGTVSAIVLVFLFIGSAPGGFTAIAAETGSVFTSTPLAITTDHQAGGVVGIEGLAPPGSVTRTITVEIIGESPFMYAISLGTEGGPQACCGRTT